MKIESFSDVVIFTGSIFRKIINVPFRFIAILIGFPNIKIIYKSGHVEYYFFRHFRVTTAADGTIEAKWEAVDVASPLHIGYNEIESIQRIY